MCEIEFIIYGLFGLWIVFSVVSCFVNKEEFDEPICDPEYD